MSYNGTNDEWKMSVVALGDCTINAGDRICQFRIQPSQKASIWTKENNFKEPLVIGSWTDIKKFFATAA